MKFNTSLLHGDFNNDNGSNTVNSTLTPIYQSTAFSYKSADQLERVFKGNEPGFLYSRIGNPTTEALERKIAGLEGAIAAVSCASGMSAVSLAILNIVANGDEIVSGSGIFGGTFSLFQNLKQFGIVTRFPKDNDISSFEKCINKKTKVVYVETIGNPKLDVPDIKELSKLAHSHNIPLIVDNTVTTPYIFKPIDFGADIVIHSTSKYINGNGSAIGGIIADSGKFKWDFEKFGMLREFEKFGPFVYTARLKHGFYKDIGPCMSPFNAFLNTIGLETLGLRMERLCSNALKLAESLSQNKKITYVNYPGLRNNPYYDIAEKQFDGKYGAMLTIRTGSKENAYTLIDNLKYAYNLSNIGDTKTLVIHPASTIYADAPEKVRENAGVYDDLIRICVGIEDIDDLTKDFNNASEKLN